MIMWPFDRKDTGLPTTHKPTGAYIMWAGRPMPTCMLWGDREGNPYRGVAIRPRSSKPSIRLWVDLIPIIAKEKYMGKLDRNLRSLVVAIAASVWRRRTSL